MMDNSDKIEVIIEEGFGGDPNGEEYVINDDSAGDKEWRDLVNHFEEIFGSISDKSEAYEIPDWHCEMRSLFVHIYDSQFYNETFVPAILSILRQQEKPCFARFECFDSEFENPENRIGLIGNFMVFRDQIRFDTLSEESGLIQRLMQKK